MLWQHNLEIFRPDHEKGEKPWGELDTVCLIDWKFVVGEVKDNVGGFTANNFESLSQICEAICPDVALLVFMEGDFNAKSMFAQKLEDLQRRLAPQTNVEWRKVPVSW